MSVLCDQGIREEALVPRLLEGIHVQVEGLLLG